MYEEMEDDCEEPWFFEDSVNIDLDFEFNVAKYFDFRRLETPDEIQESELWFESAEGHPPSPLVLNMGCGADESSESGTYNGTDISEISSLDQRKKGQQMLKAKPKSSYQECSVSISRLLKPTASHLAKQNQAKSFSSTRVPQRLQKLRNTLMSPEERATKRQKLENNYLSKVAQLGHQATFLHKTPKKGSTTDANSNARPKVTVPKEPTLATAQRALRRFNYAAQPGNKSSSNSCSTSASLQDNYDPNYKFKARPFNKKIFSSKGDIGVFRTSKREATVPREFKLSSSKKHSENPPIDLFSKLSLNSESHPGSLPEEKQHLQTKVLKNTSSSIMKENKIPDPISGNSRTSCLKQSQLSEGIIMTDIVNHPTSARRFIIH